MPFVIRKDGPEAAPFCVYTDEKDGKRHGCHATEEEARQQQKALYTNVPEARHSADLPASDPALATFDAEFSAPVAAGATVLRTGRLFRAGDYPDRSYSMTAEELAEAAEAFTPVDLDLEHVPTVLDGKLGQVLSVRAEGEELFGDVALPAWLNDVLGPDPLKVSCAWHRPTKRLGKLSLVRTPRVEDAALMAAFAGRRHSRSDQDAIQQIHDLSAEQGAACSMERIEPELGGRAHYAADPAPAPDPLVRRKNDAQGTGGKEKKRMSVREKLAALFQKAGVEIEEGELAQFAGDGAAAGGVTPPVADASATPPPAAGDPKTPPAQTAGAAAQFAQLTQAASDARVVELQRQMDELRAKQWVKDAALFAERMVQTEKRALPSEGEILAALYAQLAEDDDKNASTVTFSADGAKKGSRVEALTALYAARTPHKLTEELLETVGEEERKKFATALFNKQRAEAGEGEDQPMTPERRRQLLEMTPLGSAHFSATQAGQNGGSR